tara:strand:- start:1246 stop:2262 length:1017 start_codon:yes stop_codon:yes gene_type:complete
MKILGIETSCDETGIALYDGKANRILFEALYSQAEKHNLYGGVVPELAARDHINRLLPLLKNTMKESCLEMREIDAIAFTNGPGLRGPLMVGAGFANSLSYALDIPVIPVHHMEAHLLMAKYEADNLPYPFVSLLVSGGHTLIVKVLSPNEYNVIGQTKDDAVGEAFDKTAKLLKLGYPGGPEIERRALLAKGKHNFSFPRPMIDSKDLNFSFSGLKTSVLYKVNELSEKEDLSDDAVNDIAFEFQNAAIDCLIRKSLKACEIEESKFLVLSGGVAANKYLRNELEKHKGAINLYYPDQKHCTDNGLMIAFAGFQKITNQSKDFRIDVAPRWSLENVK